MSATSDKAGPGTKAAFGCPQCDQSFRRREHLRRHLDRHSGARPHQCNICMKKFPRIDTLKRHVSKHGPTALADWLQNNSHHHHQRACQACARGKQRCDGNDPTPCTNCASRNRRCVYGTPTSELGGSDVIPDENPASDFCNLSDAPGHIQSPVSPTSVQEGTMTTVAENVIVEPMSHTAMHFPHSSHTGAEEPLLGLPLEANAATSMLSPGSFLPMTPMSTYGFIGGLPSFFYGDDAFTDKTFWLPEQGLNDRSEELYASFGFDQSLLDRSNDQNHSTVDDEDALIAEYVPHVSVITEETRVHMINMLGANMTQTDAGHMAETFPSLQYLDTYVQLYFEHFHPRWPVLHVPSFQMLPEMWQVIFSVAFIGCQFSEASQKYKHLSLFYKLGPQVLFKASEKIFHKDPLICMQSLLLLQHCMLFAGSSKMFVQLQLHRSGLVTLCRQLLSLDGAILRNRNTAHTPSDPWLQWVRGESEHRVLYFTWMTECLQSALFMVPPLLNIFEMRFPLPSSEAHWEASAQEWQNLAPLQSPPPVCVAMAQIGSHGVVPFCLDGSARLAVLLSSFVQHTAAQDLRQAMMPHAPGLLITQSSSESRTETDLIRIAFETISKYDGSQAMKIGGAGSISNDFSVLTRVLTILDFTPVRLLHPFSRWRSSEYGANHARRELSRIVLQDIRRTRHCLHQAAQLFQYLRMVNTLQHIDTFALLICTLYIHLCNQLLFKQTEGSDVQASISLRGGLIRLDQVSDQVKIDAWLSLEHDCQPHITGIGVLGDDRSSARLYKETARIMGRSASTSSLAAALQPMMEAQAAGNVPAFEDDSG